MYLKTVWDLTYEEYVEHLLKKYGPAKHDYFDSKGNFTASRTWTDGLECHHIDEDKIPNLSDDDAWLVYPEYQKADRLVYCNRIEHLILHAKIAKMNNNKKSLRGSIGYFKGGPELLIRRLNDDYTNPPRDWSWNSKVYFKIKNWMPLYVQVLKRIELDMKELGYSDDEIYDLLFTSSNREPESIIEMYDKINLIDTMVV